SLTASVLGRARPSSGAVEVFYRAWALPSGIVTRIRFRYLTGVPATLAGLYTQVEVACCSMRSYPGGIDSNMFAAFTRPAALMTTPITPVAPPGRGVPGN